MQLRPLCSLAGDAKIGGASSAGGFGALPFCSLVPNSSPSPSRLFSVAASRRHLFSLAASCRRRVSAGPSPARREEVLYAIGELRAEMIVSPAPVTHTKILHSHRWNPYFKDCVDAIDGTHVLARVLAKERAAFMGRKHTTTQNVLAAVDFDLRFTYVLAGWEGSAHDALILADALQREDGLKVPQCKFYLVDAGYAVRPGFLPPFRGTRYGHDEHIPAEESWNANPVDVEEHNDVQHDNATWAAKRDEWAEQMWQHRGDAPIDVGQVEGQENQEGRLFWTPAMSGFVLRRFVDLVAEGVKTDKGFKDVHLNAITRDLTEFLNNGRTINGRQVYNHLRKWRAIWVKIIFGSGVATGRFALGSNEPLGNPSQAETIDLDMPEGGTEPTDTPSSCEVSDGKKKGEGTSLGKRKRVFNDDDQVVMTSMTDAIWGFGAAEKEAANSEAAPGVYDTVMGCTQFSREAMMNALDHLTVNKATGLVFVQMTPEDKDLWMTTHLAKTYFNV
ncbi:hypothetical protein U9M48_008108 [Paspalum notatum var. saurae]|uniref:DDE Tnp4 domain-containing protein n=1 Tax=Paspalum notatum var. saurae TaxID=547442 RepID=A0AAQ3WCT9_PASNO